MKENLTKRTDFKDSRRKSLAMAMVLPKNAQPWAVAAWAVPGITDMKEGTTTSDLRRSAYFNELTQASRSF